MADYLNPEALITSGSGWKPTGPFAGFLEGMRTDLGLQQLGRQAAMQELARKEQELKYAKEQADEAAYGDLRRRAEKYKQEYEINKYTSGRQEAMDTEDLITKQNNNARLEQQRLDAEEQRKLAKMETYGDLATQWVENNPGGPASNPIGYQRWLKQIKDLGLEEPNPDPAIAKQELEHMAKLYAANKHNLEIQRKYAQERALRQIDANSRVEVARARGEAPPKPPSTGVAILTDKMNRLGIPDDLQVPIIAQYGKDSAIYGTPGYRANSAGIKLENAPPPSQTTVEMLAAAVEQTKQRKANEENADARDLNAGKGNTAVPSGEYKDPTPGQLKVLSSAPSGEYKFADKTIYWDAEKKKYKVIIK